MESGRKARRTTPVAVRADHPIDSRPATHALYARADNCHQLARFLEIAPPIERPERPRRFSEGMRQPHKSFKPEAKGLMKLSPSPRQVVIGT